MPLKRSIRSRVKDLLMSHGTTDRRRAATGRDFSSSGQENPGPYHVSVVKTVNHHGLTMPAAGMNYEIVIYPRTTYNITTLLLKM